MCASACMLHTHTHAYYDDNDHMRIARSFTCCCCCCCLSSSSPTPSEKYRAVCRGNCVFHVQARRCQSAPASTTLMCVCANFHSTRVAVAAALCGGHYHHHHQSVWRWRTIDATERNHNRLITRAGECDADRARTIDESVFAPDDALR